MNRCEVCGKRLRTGWKYCSEHRNTINPNIMGLGSRKWREREFRKEATMISFIGVIFIIVGLVLLFTPSVNENFPEFSIGIKGKFFGLGALGIGLLILYFAYKSYESIPKRLMKAEERVKRRRENLREEINEELDRGY